MLEDRVRRIHDATDPTAAWAWRDPNTLLWCTGEAAATRVRTRIRQAIVELAKPAGAPRNKMGRVGFSDGVERVLAREITVLSAWAEDWDRDDHAVQTPEGVFDLAAGNLRGTGLEDQNLMCTRVTPEDVPTPYLDAKLLEMMRGDPAMREYLLDTLAFGLIGGPVEAAFFLLVGGAGTGKSVLMRFMLWLLGSYATSIHPRVFAATGARFEEYQLAWLPGKRFVWCSEPDDDAVMNEGAIKRLTGSDEDTARQIRGTPVRYQPKCNVWMTVNELPRLLRGGSPIGRRLRPITMDAPPAVEDPMMLEKMKAEAAGFLWQLCLRAGKYLTTRTLVTPAGVLDLSKAYASSASAIEPWVEAELIVTGQAGDFLSTAEALKRFRVWCGVNDYAAGELTLAGFAMRVQHALNRKLVGGYGSTARVMRAGVRRHGFPKVVLKPETNPDTGTETGAPFNSALDDDPFS
jgi:putative DNA primase/helicase